MPASKCQDEGYGTRMIWPVIKQYRPSNLPQFINRRNCVFFTFDEDKDSFGFKVNTSNLNQDRLYVFDCGVADKLFDEIIWQNNLNECKGGVFEELSKKYWSSMVQFSEFDLAEERNENREILYFSSVPPDLIKIVSKESDNFYKIYNGMKKKYNVDHAEFDEFWLLSGDGKRVDFIYFQTKKEIHISFCDKYNEEIIRSVKEIADSLDVKMGVIMVSVFKTLKIEIDQNTNKIIETPIAFDQLLKY